MRRGGYLHGRPEDLWRELIARHVPGKTFVDIGCMWRVDGEYAFLALERGASRVTGIDVEPATAAFAARNAAAGNRVRLLQGDLNDPALETWAGRHDVVFCSGVLYHLPNPILGLTQLRKVCGELLILTTASITERAEPHAAILLPHMTDAERRRLQYDSRTGKKLGLDTPFVEADGYANWFWLPTPSCVQAMVKLAGFRVREVHAHRRVTTVVATPAP